MATRKRTAEDRTVCSEYERKFVLEYCKDLDRERAAGAAGSTAQKGHKLYDEGSRLLGLVRVKAAIDQQLELLKVHSEVTVERVLKELIAIAFADPKDAFKRDGSPKTMHEIPEALRRMTKSLKVERIMRRDPEDPKSFYPVEVIDIQFWSKTDTLRDLGRYLKMFTDKVELSGKLGTVRDLLIADDTQQPQAHKA